MRKATTLRKYQKQRGSVLFIMMMILVALTIITLVATNMGKTDVQISYAYTENSKSFVKGEEMLARLRYALEQIPLPEGIAVKGKPTANRPIWLTATLAKETGSTDGEPNFTSPTFASADQNSLQGWSDEKTLKCTDIENWMNEYTELKNASVGIVGQVEENGQLKDAIISKFEPIDCSQVDPEGKTRTVIELVNRKQNEGDIDELRDTYYYRITINTKGDSTGQSLLQAVTGIQYN